MPNLVSAHVHGFSHEYVRIGPNFSRQLNIMGGGGERVKDFITNISKPARGQ